MSSFSLDPEDHYLTPDGVDRVQVKVRKKGFGHEITCHCEMRGEEISIPLKSIPSHRSDAEVLSKKDLTAVKRLARPELVRLERERVARIAALKTATSETVH